MRHLIILVGIIFCQDSLPNNPIEEEQVYTELTYIDPEQAGYSKAELKKLETLLDKFGSSSFLMLYDGKILFQYGDIHKKHLVHSIRKALLNSLIGIEYGKGHVKLETPLSELTEQITFYPELKESELAATVADLLKSRSGIYVAATAESEGMKQMKPERGKYRPGEHYYYNNLDFNFAGTYYEEVAQQSIFDAFNKQIAKPIGMKNYNGDFVSAKVKEDLKIPQTDGFYLNDKERPLFPAYHFRLTTYDLALYGQLYLNRGRWKGQQIIPEDWIDLSTTTYSIVNEKYRLGYGMLWSVIIPESDRQSSFYHTGLGVHMLGIYPSLNLVMVHRVDTEKEFSFKPYNRVQIIRQMHAARIK